MNQPPADHTSDSEQEEKHTSTGKRSRYTSSNLSLGVIAGLLLVIPVVIFLRKEYLSRQERPPEPPPGPVEMTKEVPSIITATTIPAEITTEDKILTNSFGDRIGPLFEHELPGEKVISVPRAGFEEQLLSALSADATPTDRHFILDRLYFAPGSAELNAESQEQIEATAAILQAYPVVRIQLRGHTDSSGEEETNLELSAERARNVMIALVKQGMLPVRIAHLGMGSAAPVADNDTEEGKQRNRRIDLSIFRSMGTGPRVFSY
ncbi:MAG: OmpA family protein [Pseudomonadota bacterium]